VVLLIAKAVDPPSLLMVDYTARLTGVVEAQITLLFFCGEPLYREEMA